MAFAPGSFSAQAVRNTTGFVPTGTTPGAAATPPPPSGGFNWGAIIQGLPGVQQAGLDRSTQLQNLAGDRDAAISQAQSRITDTGNPFSGVSTEARSADMANRAAMFRAGAQGLTHSSFVPTQLGNNAYGHALNTYQLGQQYNDAVNQAVGGYAQGANTANQAYDQALLQGEQTAIGNPAYTPYGAGVGVPRPSPGSSYPVVQPGSPNISGSRMVIGGPMFGHPVPAGSIGTAATHTMGHVGGIGSAVSHSGFNPSGVIGRSAIWR